jgi:ubiquinone/menaquinone biosynthesis C-methylase UbiE
MPPDAAGFTVTSQARFSFSVPLLRWDMELGCYRLGGSVGNGLVTLRSLAQSCLARFRNSFSGGIGEIEAMNYECRNENTMSERSIAAYDVSQRVKTYDADMELMHPNRSKMVQIALEVLPFPKTTALRAIDLGIGTGYFTECFLNKFPNGRVLGIDGAPTMIELAKARLTLLASRVEYVIGDFRRLQELAAGAGTVDVIFSSYALHHLSRSDKEAVLKQMVALLVPGGWFLNADLIVADSAELETRLQQIRIAGIVERAGGADSRFADSALTRQFLADLEIKEADQPLTLTEDLALLRSSGLKNVSAFWLEYRELVGGGQK